MGSLVIVIGPSGETLLKVNDMGWFRISNRTEDKHMSSLFRSDTTNFIPYTKTQTKQKTL